LDRRSIVTKSAGNIITADYFDRKATRHIKKAAEFAALADRARTAKSRDKYYRKAQQERDAAIDCLEQAKNQARK
jgi:hypothetical protein